MNASVKFNFGVKISPQSDFQRGDTPLKPSKKTKKHKRRRGCYLILVTWNIGYRTIDLKDIWQ